MLLPPILICFSRDNSTITFEMIFLKITVILECRFYFIYIYIHKPRFHKRYVPPIFPSPAIFNKANRERRERRGGEGRSEKMRRRESGKGQVADDFIFSRAVTIIPSAAKSRRDYCRNVIASDYPSG